MPFPYILKDKYLRIAFGASLFLLAISGIISYVYFGDTETPFILHFDRYERIDFFGDTSKMFGVVATGLAMIIINLILANLLYTRERFLSYVFAWVSVGVTTLILFAILAIVGAN